MSELEFREALAKAAKALRVDVLTVIGNAWRCAGNDEARAMLDRYRDDVLEERRQREQQFEERRQALVGGPWWWGP